jgi:hypothetical protein
MKAHNETCTRVHEATEIAAHYALRCALPRCVRITLRDQTSALVSVLSCWDGAPRTGEVSQEQWTEIRPSRTMPDNQRASVGVPCALADKATDKNTDRTIDDS